MDRSVRLNVPLFGEGFVKVFVFRDSFWLERGGLVDSVSFKAN